MSTWLRNTCFPPRLCLFWDFLLVLAWRARSWEWRYFLSEGQVKSEQTNKWNVDSRGSHGYWQDVTASPVSHLFPFCRLCHPKGFLDPQQWKRKADPRPPPGSVPRLSSGFLLLISLLPATPKPRRPWYLTPPAASSPSLTPLHSRPIDTLAV